MYRKWVKIGLPSSAQAEKELGTGKSSMVFRSHAVFDLHEGKVRIIFELARKISERAREPEQSREA